MRKSRKTGKIIVLLLVCVFLLFSVAGCAPKMREEGYFTYYIRKANDGVKYAHISELTELGKQQKVLVIPEEIGGKKVIALDKWKFDMWSPGLVWGSENLEKVFFTTDNIGVENGTFKRCLNLKKVILTAYDGYDLSSLDSRISNIIIGYKNRCLYVSKKAFELYIMQLINNRNIIEEEAILLACVDYRVKPADVSFYYNYDTEINYGYYWVDDENYGETIDYIPQDPTRDGYDFDGWYREVSCINKWDFDIDTLPQEQFDEKGNSIYQETKLYAKWIIKQ